MYPFSLRISNKKILFVGGGDVATRKIGSLLKLAAPQITIIAPNVAVGLAELIHSNGLFWLKREFRDDDINTDWDFIFACTDNRRLNNSIGRAATDYKILVNVADDAELSTLHMPAMAEVDGTIIAVSTNGDSPARAKMIRDKVLGFLQQL